MKGRLDRLRALLRAEEIDGVLITSPVNRFYHSGFLSDDDGGQVTAALLVDRDSATLMTGATNVDWAKGMAQGVAVEEWSRPWPPFVADVIKASGWIRLGFEDTTLTVAAYVSLRSELASNVAMMPLGQRLDRLRRTKDEAERRQMRRVIEITDEAFADTVSGLSEGMTEREIAWRVDRALRDRGADGSAFPTIVASGPNSSRPHHAPSDRVIRRGEPIIIDMGAKLDGYNADLTRTVWLGEADSRLPEIVSVVTAAHSASWDLVAAGVRAEDIHGAAKSVAESAGYGDNYVHGTGHGLGINVHEAPSCGDGSPDVLQVGDLLTIEPGVYIDGWGGVRIEDVGVIEDDGFRRLTRAARQIE